MGIDAGPDAGTFEPRPAKFYNVTYPVGDAGGARPLKDVAAYCTRYFRWNRTYGRELNIEQQVKANQTICIEIRRDRKTLLIKRNTIATVNGSTYGITDIQPKPSNSEFLMIIMSTNMPDAY